MRGVHPATSQSAFSLVELSIVLVILGLLTGGILAGQSLVRAAELRSVTTEYDRYRAAVGSFRDKYFALPGDMPNATKFWGVISLVDNSCRNGSPTTTETCDGNGDGLIAEIGRSAEFYRFWQHLANAGLINGNYTGASNGLGSNEADSIGIGQNTPVSRMANGTWFVNTEYGWTSAWWGSAVSSGNYFIFGGNEYGGPYMDTPMLKPAEAWNIDVKIDDGKPGSGNVHSWIDARSCTFVPPATLPDSTIHMATAEYDVRNVITGPGVRAIDGCNLLFRKLY